MDRPLRDLVEHVARALVDEPDAVDVRATESDNATVLDLRVSKADLGKIIGKKGNTARAIRAVVAAAALKMHARAVLNIVEE